ncbi:hypothetical protein OIU92_00185 [Escherichia coli]|nr:hypothetical protein [Escherichia coli]
MRELALPQAASVGTGSGFSERVSLARQGVLRSQKIVKFQTSSNGTCTFTCLSSTVPRTLWIAGLQGIAR